MPEKVLVRKTDFSQQATIETYLVGRHEPGVKNIYVTGPLTSALIP
jgi:hypothetical protein